MKSAGKGRDEGGFEDGSRREGTRGALRMEAAEKGRGIADGSHREGRGRGGVVAGGCGGFARRCVVDGCWFDCVHKEC